MRPRTLITLAATVCALLLAVAGCGSGSSNSSSSSSATSTASSAATATSSAATSTATASSTTSGPQIGFEAVPLEQGPDLASASTTQPTAVDGIQCKPSEQLVYHIHAHLAVFDSGRLYALPGGIGIPGSQNEQSQYGPVAVGGQCYFWLHTHTADGVIHVESPERAIFTLGDFFDVWRQPLTADRIASLHGKVSAFVNGKPWHKSVRAIPLLPHADIQLEIGEPIPPIVTVNWKKTSL
ncbi:MAG TPA: hypothetical protein VHW04_23900 [Solirubrobacteraceae bacterium]|jgi:hypothetical protein|nr:hypothetical protein [Solirubrobacteraceae bacterium]